MKFFVAASFLLTVLVVAHDFNDTIDSSDMASDTPKELFPEPSKEQKCVLKIAIKLLQDDLDHTTSCDSLTEYLSAAKQCPYGESSASLVDDISDTFNHFCGGTTATTDEPTTPPSSTVEN